MSSITEIFPASRNFFQHHGIFFFSITENFVFSKTESSLFSNTENFYSITENGQHRGKSNLRKKNMW